MISINGWPWTVCLSGGQEKQKLSGACVEQQHLFLQLIAIHLQNPVNLFLHLLPTKTCYYSGPMQGRKPINANMYCQEGVQNKTVSQKKPCL